VAVAIGVVRDAVAGGRLFFSSDKPFIGVTVFDPERPVHQRVARRGLNGSLAMLFDVGVGAGEVAHGAALFPTRKLEIAFASHAQEQHDTSAGQLHVDSQVAR